MDTNSLYSPEWAVNDDVIAFISTFPRMQGSKVSLLQALLSLCLDNHAWKCAEKILDAGYDINRIDEQDSSDLVQRIALCDNSSVAWLIERGANIESPRQISRGFPIHFAVYAGNLEAIDLLIAAGANLATRDASNATALWTAIFLNAPRAFERLLAGGADLNILGPSGGSLLEYARSNGLDEIVELIDKHGKISPPKPKTE